MSAFRRRSLLVVLIVLTCAAVIVHIAARQKFRDCVTNHFARA